MRTAHAHAHMPIQVGSVYEVELPADVQLLLSRMTVVVSRLPPTAEFSRPAHRVLAAPRALYALLPNPYYTLRTR